MSPTSLPYDIVCAYIEDLVKTTPSPRTVKNKLSHIRTYLRKVGVPTHDMDHFRVKWACTALDRNSTYIPRTKEAMSTTVLYNMVTTLPHDLQALNVKVAVLVIYYAALRQSEVLAPSVKGYDPAKHLSRADVQLLDACLQVKVKHAKNMQSIYQSKVITLQASPDPRLCIVALTRRMIQATPTQHPTDPFIMCHFTRRPVSVETVRKIWSKHLRAQGVDVTHLSLHSIRKAAATAAHAHGCTEMQIQKYGGWRSNAHRLYITPDQTPVNAAITQALSHN